MKKLFSALVFVMAIAFLLVGCSTGLVLPPNNAIIKGNGGFVVQKGEYIYFANAYTTVSSLSADVKNDGSSKEFSLYRVKVSDALNAVITYDEEGFATGVEKIADKIAGFDNAGMFIVGDYLFYGSPNVHKTSRNEDRFDLVTIFSVKLDGSEHKELYTTADYTNGDWTILNVDNKSYVITYEGNNIIRQEISNGSFKNKTTLVSNAISTILVDEVKYDFDKDIYFTTERSQEEKDLGLTGTILKKVNVSSGQITSFDNPVGETVTLINHVNSKLIYKLTKSNVTDSLYVKSLTGADIRLTYWAGTQVFFMGFDIDNSQKPVVYVSQSKLVMQNINSFEIEILVDADVTILFVNGDYIYYSTGSAISRISYKDKVVQEVIETTEADKVDFDGRYIYVFTTLDNPLIETKYLHRVDTYSIEQNTTRVLKPVGFVLPEHKENEEA